MADGSPAFIETSTDPAAERAQRQQDRLERLIDHGLEITAVLAAKAKSSDPEAEAAGRAYARVSRAVRLAMALSAKLAEDQQRREGRLRSDAASAAHMAAFAAAEQAAQEANALQAREDDAKFRAHRILKRVIRAEHDDPDRIERLDTESADRLDDDDIYGAVLTRPLSDIVADICRDLGLTPDWARLAEELWAQEEIASGEVGESLSGFGATRPPPFAGEVAQRAGGGIPLVSPPEPPS